MAVRRYLSPGSVRPRPRHGVEHDGIAIARRTDRDFPASPPPATVRMIGASEARRARQAEILKSSWTCPPLPISNRSRRGHAFAPALARRSDVRHAEKCYSDERV